MKKHFVVHVIEEWDQPYWVKAKTKEEARTMVVRGGGEKLMPQKLISSTEPNPVNWKVEEA